MMNNHSEAEKTEINRIARAMMPPRESDWSDAELTAFYAMASAAFETMKEQSEKKISEAVAVERKQWSDTVANALNWLKHGRIANARDGLNAAQRRAANEAIRSAAK